MSRLFLLVARCSAEQPFCVEGERGELNKREKGKDEGERREGGDERSMRESGRKGTCIWKEKRE